MEIKVLNPSDMLMPYFSGETFPENAVTGQIHNLTDAKGVNLTYVYDGKGRWTVAPQQVTINIPVVHASAYFRDSSGKRTTNERLTYKMLREHHIRLPVGSILVTDEDLYFLVEERDLIDVTPLMRVAMRNRDN